MHTDTNQLGGAKSRQNPQETNHNSTADGDNCLRQLLEAYQNFTEAIAPLMAVVSSDDKAVFLRVVESYIDDLWDQPTSDQYLEQPTDKLAVQI